MTRRRAFRDGEKHLSQIPALHLLQKMSPRWVMLTRAEADRERRGKLSNVLLEDILRERLMALNAIEHRGRSYPFSEANIQTAIERLRTREPLGLMKLNELTTDLLQLGTSLDQTIEGETRGRSLRYVDWERPERNAFHVAKEFVVECAGHEGNAAARHRAVRQRHPVLRDRVQRAERGFRARRFPRHIRNQGTDEIPHLFRTVQLLIATNRIRRNTRPSARGAKFWSIWREKEIADDEIARLVSAPARSRGDATHLRRRLRGGARALRAS